MIGQTWHSEIRQFEDEKTGRSVTQLTHGNDEYVKFDYSGVLQRRPQVLAAA